MSLLKDEIELNVQEAELYAKKKVSQFPPILIWLVVIVLLAIIPAYYISRATAEKIWLARYEQGAITAKPSFTNPQAPTTTAVTLVNSGSGGFAAVTQISNQNLDLSVDNVPYSFIFYNAQKQQIYQYQGTLFLLPDQTKYITAPTFTPTEPIAYVNFQLPQPQNIPWQKRIDIPTVNLSTSLPQTFEQTSPLAFVAQGDFYNGSPYTLNKLRLTFVLFNQNQNIIGVSQRDESTVAPFERRAYKQLWPNMTAGNLSSVDVTADTDTLDPGDLSIPAVNTDSASDLSRPAPAKQ
jgi:hypothetical protein